MRGSQIGGIRCPQPVRRDLDRVTLLGLLLAVVSVVVGSILKGAALAALLSIAALMIVLLGTVAAVLVQTPEPTLRRAIAMSSLSRTIFASFVHAAGSTS